MGGKLTTHVLDTARGVPAAGVWITLWRLGADDARVEVKSVRTNADGRTDEPLLSGAETEAGIYEIIFAVGDYFRAGGADATGPPFLDDVPVRFGIADPEDHYHVPLLVSPWAYSTYRGS
jgi:5-hydroxyisourate hydrolase